MPFSSDPNYCLFDLEAIVKTTKGLFHNLKQRHLSQEEYLDMGPLFVYDVLRGSSKYRFLGPLKGILVFAASVWGSYRKGNMQHKAEKLALVEQLRKQFPHADIPDIMGYINAPPWEEDAALTKLYQQGLKTIEVSRKPFDGNIEYATKTLLALDKLNEDK